MRKIFGGRSRKNQPTPKLYMPTVFGRPFKYEIAADMRRDGKTDDQIIKALGCCPTYLAVLHNHPRNSKNTDTAAQAKKMRENGRTIQAIADALGVSRQRVGQLLSPEKEIARRLLKTAVADGMILKPSRCQHCGKRADKIEAHHPDYSKALAVEWLCVPCHSKIPVKKTYREHFNMLREQQAA